MAERNVLPIQIMTLNVGGRGAAQVRRDLIRNFQPQLRQCSVIFVQECNSRADRNNLMRILGNGYQISPENIDVAIIWDQEMFLDVEVIPDETINNIINDNGLFQQMINQNYVINDRVKVIRATLARRVVYFASWHGPHRHFAVDRKEETARDLIRLMRNISRRQPFIIGGDFNLLADNQFPVQGGVEVLHNIPNPPMHDIDYFVLRNGRNGVFDVENVDRLPLSDSNTLDHQPVQARFRQV